MKQRERHYQPRDERAYRRDREKQTDIGGKRVDHEFEAMFAMHEHVAPDMKSDQERAENEMSDALGKDEEKGFGR